MTPFPNPALLIMGPLVAAVLLLIPGRWPRVQSIAGACAAIVLAIWTAVLPVGPDQSGASNDLFRGNSWIIAGRPFIIDEGLQSLFVFFFAALALLFLLSYLFWQGSTFIPAGLAAMSPLSAALMVELTAFGAILLVIAASLLVMTYSPLIRQKTLGSLRYLLFFAIALAPLLFAAWLLESGQAALNTPLIVMMVTAAFAILLAGFPFYIWVNPIVTETPLFVPALIFGVAQTGIFIFILLTFQSYPMLLLNEQLQSWLVWSGMGTVLVAALLVLIAGQWRFLLGHLLLLNMGMSILTLTIPNHIVTEMAILFHISRFISLLLAGTALSLMNLQGWCEEAASNQGYGRSAPLTLALLAYSFFSLLGAPLTIGFPSQWGLITTFGQQSNLWMSALLVLAMGVSAYRVLRILAAIIQEENKESGIKEARWQQALAGILLICALLLALFPGPLINYAKELSTAIFG